jgi:hypothetical protein
MATTLRDFIAQREAEIRDQQKILRAELRDLQIAKTALEAQNPSETSKGTGSGLTIKEMAREVLSGQPNGLNSSGILDAIRKTFGREVERTSLSPQLSRLKDDGELALDGEVWFTTDHYAAAQSRARSEPDENPFDSYPADRGHTHASPWDIDDSEVPF